MTEKTRFDPRIWRTEDGHRYTSVPTTVPQKWTPALTGNNLMGTERRVYVSGEYVIKREPYGKTAWTYALFRGNLQITSGYARLKDTKEHAVKNARGEETVYVA